MNWPTHSDYQDAIQNPAVCFQEPELKGGEAAQDMLGLPRVMSGNFASVYELKTSGARYAIRCFVRQVSGQQGRYARLSQHLNSVTLEYLVPFEYMLKGILIKGEWFPMVKMQWVEGVPLNTWVDQHVNDPAALTKMAADWRVMMGKLVHLKLAHGDLQHGNIMVTPNDELRLVDYDGMYAPVFGRGRAPELGHINFQHPRRTSDFYQEDLDNFSALVIYTSLRALAVEPELWQKFYTVDNLLLVSADFKAPLQSAALQRLKESKDPAVQQLAKLIERCCIGPVETVPDFSSVMAALDQGTLDQLPPKTASVAPPPRPTPAAAPAPVAAPVPALEKGSMRSAYDNVATVATKHSTTFQSSSNASTTTARLPGADNKHGVPVWVWAVVAAVAIIVGMVVVLSKKQSAEPVAAAPAASAPAPAPSSSSPGTPTPSAPAGKPQLTPPPAALKVSLLGTLKGHRGGIDVLTFSRDGKLLASGGPDKSIHLWDAQSGQSKTVLSGFADSPATISFSTDGKVLLAVSLDNILHVFDTSTGQQKKSLADQSRNLFNIVVSPDGSTLVTGDADRKIVRLLDWQTGALKKSLASHSSWVRSIGYSADGRILAVGCHDDTIHIWDLAAGQLLRSISATGNSLDFPVLSADGSFIAAGGENRSIRIWNSKSGELLQTLSGHADDVKALAFSPDGKLLASGSADKSVRLWDVRSGSQKQLLSGHAGAVTAVTFSPGGKLFSSGSADQTVKLWEIQ